MSANSDRFKELLQSLELPSGRKRIAVLLGEEFRFECRRVAARRAYLYKKAWGCFSKEELLEIRKEYEARIGGPLEREDEPQTSSTDSGEQA